MSQTESSHKISLQKPKFIIAHGIKTTNRVSGLRITPVDIRAKLNRKASSHYRIELLSLSEITLEDHKFSTLMLFRRNNLNKFTKALNINIHYTCYHLIEAFNRIEYLNVDFASGKKYTYAKRIGPSLKHLYDLKDL